MSKPFDYSKWDNIELSDDEDDVHPNIDKESWFRMKHRSRVEREEAEEADKKKIHQAMEKANLRIKVLQHELNRIQMDNAALKDDDDDDDDDLDEGEGIKAEIRELEQANAARQAKLDEYEKHKKWNVDNLCHVVEEKTIVGTKVTTKYTPDGFVAPTDSLKPEAKVEAPVSEPAAAVATKDAKETAARVPSKQEAPPATTKKAASTSATSTTKPAADSKQGPKTDLGSFDTYHEFTVKYADLLEEFMKIRDLEKTKAFLIQHGEVILQENASNYLLLASLEDEMNGQREKMRQTARQSQIISNITELAKSLQTHPGNVIIPFFQKLEKKELFEQFMTGCRDFEEKIIARAVVKKKEIDEARAAEQAAAGDEGVSLEDIPKEERLGPGGLDPLEVIETLPQEMVDAFESRDVEQLKEALSKMDPEEAARHMKRCIDSGLWVA
jgi:cell division cycle protein 37